MKYVEAPDILTDRRMPAVFLAGGITDCPDWQTAVVGSLKDENVALLNPRRANFPIDDPQAAVNQIHWEYLHLRTADAVLFWFPRETLCPIALYELGAWSKTNKPIFVGTHPEYKRRQDVVIQTQLARLEVTVRETLDELVADAKKWLKYRS